MYNTFSTEQGCQLCIQHPNVEDQAPVWVFMNTRDRVAQLHHQAHGSIFIPFHNLHSYGGGILTYLHMGR
jgi:hypothetical protein